MEAFVASSFGVFLVSLFSQYFTAPSCQSFLILAYGWSMASRRHTIATYLWLSGAVRSKHFSRFYFFLSHPFTKVADQLWSVVIQRASGFVPERMPIRIKIDDLIKKKSGKAIAGASRYRNGAGSARQEYRTLWGLNFVYAIMLVPLQLRQIHWLAIPIGLKVYLKESVAKELGQSYHSRSTLSRKMIDLAALALPNRRILANGDGGYATKDFLRNLPQSVKVVSRFPINSKLYELPQPPPKGRRGPKPKKGKLMGSPKTLIERQIGWQDHPTEKGALIQAFTGIWHTVLPQVAIHVVVVRRPNVQKSRKRPFEAFFTTDLSLSVAEILSEYQSRWCIEIDIRDANAYYGLGADQCRNLKRIAGVNNFRLLMAAARTLWFIQQIQSSEHIDWKRFRPWYRQKSHPSQLDVVSAFHEALSYQAIYPTIRFLQDMPEIQPSQEHSLPKAA